MVRLKDSRIHPSLLATQKFQFHSGSIKSQWVGIDIDEEAQFQFHSGSIKRKNRTISR